VKPRILVTGAGGLIGRRVLDLLQPQYEPVALVRDAGCVSSDVETIEADLGAPDFAARLPTRMDGVIHLAQSSDFARFPDGARDVFAVNVHGLSAVLDWARKSGVSQFVHASTGGVYGKGTGAFREEDRPRISGTLAHYISTKLAAELIASAYAGLFSVAALRFFFVYGEAQRKMMLLPRLVEAVMSGTPVTLAGSDGMRLNPIYIDDAAAATVAALRLPGNSIVNIAGSEILSIRQIAETIGEACGVEAKFQCTAKNDGDLVGDTRQMRELLHCPAVSFRDGIARLIRARSSGLV